MGAIQNDARRFWPDSAASAATDEGVVAQEVRASTPRRGGRVRASTFIQIIETRWSGQSRIAPQSVIRNAVPMIFRAPVEGPHAAVLLHRALCCETQGFSPCVEAQFEPFSADLAAQYRLAVHPERQGVRVEFFGAPMPPAADTASDSVVLSAGMWLRIVANRRVAAEDGWGYQRFVYNIAHCEPAAINTLLAGSAPVLSINRETQL